MNELIMTHWTMVSTELEKVDQRREIRSMETEGETRWFRLASLRDSGKDEKPGRHVHEELNVK